MHLTCKYNSGYVGRTKDGRELTLHVWRNLWLLMKHLRHVRIEHKDFETSVDIEVDVDIKS